LRAGTDTELAELLYRAPSELLRGLNRETGTKLLKVLRETGIDVDLVPPTETYEPGSAAYEVALVIKRPDRMLDVIRETMRVLGVDVDTARKLVCANPAVLIGRVSQATVEALRRRYETLGVELDVSRSVDAEFDLAVDTSDFATRKRLERLLADEQIPVAVSEAGQFLATGLEAPAAERIWKKLREADVKVQVLNRDFQRFDVRMESAPGAPGDHDPRRRALLDWMVSTIGMPAKSAERALAHLPFILVENISGGEMVTLLHQIHERGAGASAILLPLQKFALAVKPGGDRDSARSRIETITQSTPPPGFELGNPATLEGPFTKTQARWLQHELRRVNVHSVLVER
jgi:ribosomal protein L7/L12